MSSSSGIADEEVTKSEHVFLRDNTGNMLNLQYYCVVVLPPILLNVVMDVPYK